METALAGLDPMIAMALVEMGMDLEGVHPALNLETTLELLAEARHKRGLSPEILYSEEDLDGEEEAGLAELTDAPGPETSLGS